MKQALAARSCIANTKRYRFLAGAIGHLGIVLCEITKVLKRQSKFFSYIFCDFC